MAECRVMVIGNGGREHALAWKLSESCYVSKVYVVPGNAGTNFGDKVTNVDMKVNDFEAVSFWCQKTGIDFILVGPEDPLADGIADHLKSKGLACFGPSAAAAMIESSKDFAKKFMEHHSIPTARYESFINEEAACRHINEADYNALVVKASGLAAGKGVVVASNRIEACNAVKMMFTDKKFGSAGDVVLVEELLVGDEISVLAFTDGVTVSLMPPTQDHKRLLDNDCGPNTGGMGAYCPYSKLNQSETLTINRIMQRVVDALRREGRKYVGVLYAGMMLTEAGPMVLEFNCRFGDPETQCLMPLLLSDLYLVCKACVDGTLVDNMAEFDLSRTTLGIVMVSSGYPGPYQKGKEITGVQDAECSGLLVFHAGTGIKEGKYVTNGGRVLTVVATATNLHSASQQAMTGVRLVNFDGSYHRSDIGHRAVSYRPTSDHSTYRDCGVNIDAGNELIAAIKPLALGTQRPGCLSSLGQFGALFDLKATGYLDPILVSGTDGVGTKLKVAQDVGRHGTVGVDLVAMCVNDILSHGAEPLFFLDYFSSSRLRVPLARAVIAGIAAGCKEAGCALVGGETAEMPGMYSAEEYDLAGFALGAVERGLVLPKRDSIGVDDVLVGLSSSGLHSNGYSLVRHLVARERLTYDMPSPFQTGVTLGESLLTPTKIYVRSVLPIMKLGMVKAFAHITGGGLLENIVRVLPDDKGVELDANLWTVPPVFKWIASIGGIETNEMARTFNCGIGAVLIVDKSSSKDVLRRLRLNGEAATVIGAVDSFHGDRRVRISKLSAALQVPLGGLITGEKKRVAVLISGTGTNLQALVDHTRDPHQKSVAEIVLVISNKPGVRGLQRADGAGIEAKVIEHSNFKSRKAFDSALHDCLVAADIQIVCLAGFMRILTPGFVSAWRGRMLNVHPSLLPAFKGVNAHRQVLNAGVQVTGCTVHFVVEDVDAGAILLQEEVAVHDGDTEERLAERVRCAEHRIYPVALDMLASGAVRLLDDGTVFQRCCC